jgi:hypothetical protein
MNNSLSNRILNYLNDKYNINGTVIKSINTISMEEGYYRIDADIIEVFNNGINFNDTSIFFVDINEIK